MHFLITGSAGFIGFHLSKRLLEQGHSVVGFDGLTPYYDVCLKEERHRLLAEHSRFTPCIGQLESASALMDAVDIAKPDVIIHLAAQAGVRYSLENPEAYVSSNMVGSWNVLEVARRFRPRHLMMASTSSVYGANPRQPFSESDRADEPLTLYAASKKAMEVMAHSYAHLYDVPTTAFRFFTVYGPYGRPDMALFKFVKAIVENKAIQVFGDGKTSRDFTYVDDLVESVARLIPIAPNESNRVEGLDTLSQQAPFRVVNIGGGNPVVLLDFIETIERVLGKKAIRTLLPMQPGDAPSTSCEPALLRALTDFRPSTRLEDGIASFVDWYSSYHSQERSSPLLHFQRGLV